MKKTATTKANGAPVATEARQAIAKIVRGLTDAPQRTESRIVLLTWEAVQAIAETCGVTVERNDKGKITDITIRGNRPEQVTTKKLLDVLKNEPEAWDCHVAHVYIRLGTEENPLCDIVEGGNTFRASYYYLDEFKDKTVAVTLEMSETLRFETWNQIQSPKTNKTMLSIKFQDGNEGIYSELFGLSCVRVLGKSVKGGDVDKRTWRKQVWKPSKIVSMFEDAWFSQLWELATHENQDKQSLLSLGRTLTETLKGWKDMHISYLITAYIDATSNAWIYEEDEDGKTNSEKFDSHLTKISNNLHRITELMKPVFTPPTKGMSFGPDAKYAAIYDLVLRSVKGKALPQTAQTDTIPRLGVVEAFRLFEGIEDE